MRRWRYRLTNRRRRFDPPFVQQAVTAPGFVPRHTRHRAARLAVPSRRGVFLFAPPAPAASVQRPLSRRRPGAPRIRRAEFFSAPPSVVMLGGSGPVPPTTLRASRRPSVPRRRGTFAEPVWPQQAPPAVPEVPQRTERPTARRATLVRRGRFFALVVSAPEPPAPADRVPGFARRARPATLKQRRGRFSTRIPAQVVPPGFICQDFSAATTVVAYSASSTPVAYSGSVIVETYSATASVCGR